MRLSSRMRIAQHGYESVTIELASEYNYYRDVLARNQFKISRSRVIQLTKMEQAGDDAKRCARDFGDGTARSPAQR